MLADTVTTDRRLEQGRLRILIVPGAGSAQIILKASDENLGEEDSRWHWRRQAILDGTWMLPNVEKVKG